MKRILLASLIGFASIGFHIQAGAQDQKRTDLVTMDLGADHFAAGQNVVVRQPVAGDLLAAGREVVVSEKVGGDAAAAGGMVRLNGNISDNTYAAGGEVFVNGTLSRGWRADEWRFHHRRGSSAAPVSPRAKCG